MLKEHARVFAGILLISDFVVVVLSFIIAYYLANNFTMLHNWTEYISVLASTVIFWLTTLYYVGIYDSFRLKKPSNIVFSIFRSAFFGFIVTATILYVTNFDFVSRMFMATVFFTTAVMLSISRILILKFFHILRSSGKNYRRLLVIGTGESARKFLKILERHDEWGYQVIGLIETGAQETAELDSKYSIIGNYKDIPSLLKNQVIDEVVIAVNSEELSNLHAIMQQFETQGIVIHIAVDFFHLQLTKAVPTELDNFPLLTFRPTPTSLGALTFKRVLDVLLSLTGIILCAPLFVLVAIGIKSSSKGAILFKQKRMGMNGRIFTLYKFRTMEAMAEEKLSQLLQHNEMSGPIFKMQNDPRITTFGKFLRKYSIDELPQLWNVFVGDMSLVGPRPPIPGEVDQYNAWHRRRLSMRPGLTCLWQVSGRNKISSFDDWVKMDLQYIDNWSLWQDFKILARTIPAIVSASGR